MDLWLRVLIVINFLSLLMMGYDKVMARRGGWRIPERSLFLLALGGGAAGIMTAMFLFRHKTRHLTFRLGIPLLLALNVICVYYLFLRI